jgi:hypothetical protein
MKKHIAKFLTLSLVLTSAIGFSPLSNGVDVVSAATAVTTTPYVKPVVTVKPTTVAATSAKISRILKSGSVGSEVKTLQSLFNSKGYKLTVDGFYGSMTHHAVVDFQKKNGLVADGIVGPKTLAILSPVAPVVAVKPVTPPAVVATKLFHGFGEAVNYRVRGDKKDNLNITTASAIFDKDGKIVNLTWDVMEITYALFPGWLPATADQATKDAFVKSIDDVWETKVEEGWEYNMSGKKATATKEAGIATNSSGKEWFEQLNYFETFFKGKTVAEVEDWMKMYTDANGRPYKMAYPEKITTEADKATVAKFTDKEKAMLVDVTTSATMSLQDGHSHFITALKEAYEARKEIK